MFSQHLLNPPGSIPPPPEPVKKRPERPKPQPIPINYLASINGSEHEERVAELLANYESPDELIHVKEIQLNERSLERPLVADEAEVIKNTVGVESRYATGAARGRLEVDVLPEVFEAYSMASLGGRPEKVKPGSGSCGEQKYAIDPVGGDVISLGSTQQDPNCATKMETIIDKSSGGAVEPTSGGLAGGKLSPGPHGFAVPTVAVAAR